MKVGDLLTYDCLVVANPWNGKQALFLEGPTKDGEMNMYSLITVLIDGVVDTISVVHFLEFREHYGWRFGV